MPKHEIVDDDFVPVVAMTSEIKTTLVDSLTALNDLGAKVDTLIAGVADVLARMDTMIALLTEIKDNTKKPGGGPAK